MFYDFAVIAEAEDIHHGLPAVLGITWDVDAQPKQIAFCGNAFDLGAGVEGGFQIGCEGIDEYLSSVGDFGVLW